MSSSLESPYRYNKREKSPCMVHTETTELQSETEDECSPFFVHLPSLPQSQVEHLRQVGLLPTSKEGDDNDEETFDVQLLREKHVNFCGRALLRPLGPAYVSLDASRPWMIYWTLHSLDLLDSLPSPRVLDGVVESLKRCLQVTSATISGKAVKTGGFGGGPGQMAHCAPTYAAVLALAIVSDSCTSNGDLYREVSEQAIEFLKDIRPLLYQFFLSLRFECEGQECATGFRMHYDGEVDVRGTYTVVCISALLGMCTESLTRNVRGYILNCQTYEGGFGAEPGSEAHGGYTFCAIAALKILNCWEGLDLESLKGWICRRQMGYEGGFSGRCNKLVDGCYSFWQGGALAVLDLLMNQKGGTFDDGVLGDSRDVQKVDIDDDTKSGGLSFDQVYLQRYILMCAQSVSGGLRDKPSKSRDFYHTCYNLSGLSIAQHVLTDGGKTLIYGHSNNVIEKTHSCFNIRVERVAKMKNQFCQAREIIDDDNFLYTK